MGVVSKFQRAYKRDGFFGTVRLAVRNLTAMPVAAHRSPAKKSPFDEKYGVDTDAWVEVEDLGVDGPSKTFACVYGPMTLKIWEDAIALLDIDHRNFTFIDLGSGKGRALMLAAVHPFRKIIGVEFSETLHRIAMRNLEIYPGPRLCPDIRSQCCDAAAFSFPETPLVLLLYNPFVGDVMRQVVRNIEQSVMRSPRPVYVLYMNPTDAGALDQSRVLREIAHTNHCRIFAAGV